MTPGNTGKGRTYYDYNTEYPTAPHDAAAASILSRPDSSRGSFDNVGLVEWYLSPYRKYFVFTGRARRIEYYTFSVVNALVIRSLFWLADPDRHMSWMGLFFRLLAVLCFLAVVVPSTALAVRRCHDVNLSGALLFIWLVPIAGLILSLYLAWAPSHAGSNQFGPDPLGVDFQPSATKSAAKGWYADPRARHQVRFWNADAWTALVADGGVVSEDRG